MSKPSKLRTVIMAEKTENGTDESLGYVLEDYADLGEIEANEAEE